MKIPTYEEASERVVSGTSSNLDWFIVENEPGGLGTERFRRELSNAIEEVVKEVNESGKGATIRITTEDQQNPLTAVEMAQVAFMMSFAAFSIILVIFIAISTLTNCLSVLRLPH